MVFRLLFVFGCVVVFINGCNSLISSQVGTHKLRTYAMAEVLEEGIGDADFVAITGAWQTGDYVYVAPVRQFDKPILIYPVTANGAENARAIPVVAWTELFDPSCVERGDCLPQGETTLRGIVRDIPKEKDNSSALARKGYTLAERPIFIEADKAPLAWYWSLAMMVGALALGAGIEIAQLRKTRKQQLQD
jgi:hypothetical protein